MGRELGSNSEPETRRLLVGLIDHTINVTFEAMRRHYIKRKARAVMRFRGFRVQTVQ